MYQIKCDNYVLYDPRDDDLILTNPKCKLEVNKVGSASFTIYANHPYYDRLKILRSVVEIKQGGQTIFRGRITENTRGFDNAKAVDVEGVMAYFNDSIVKPFAFPDDFEGKEEYETAKEAGNVVSFFLGWLIDNHNAQVSDFQKFKLGNVTVTDTNNALYFSSKDYIKTWSVIESRLFKGSLGGYLCIRYEDDGNYIDYVSDFDLTNVQPIEFGENLLDIVTDSDAAETYTAVLPLGMKKKDIEEASDTNSDTNSEDESRLTIEGLPDGEINDDIVKKGDTLYSKSGVEQYGFIYAPIADTTFDDVSFDTNLQDQGSKYLTETAIKLKGTITITAVDLHFADADIAAFRIYRKISVYSAPHEHKGTYNLTKLDIDILNPQNTKITLGDTVKTFTDINAVIKKQVEAVAKSMAQQTTTIISKPVGSTDKIKLSLSINFETNESETNHPYCKCYGDIVTVAGVVISLTDIGASEQPIAIASDIPSSLRPDSDQIFVCQGDGMNRWTCTIKTDGSVNLSLYGTTEASTVPAATRLDFNCTYTI